MRRLNTSALSHQSPGIMWPWPRSAETVRATCAPVTRRTGIDMMARFASLIALAVVLSGCVGPTVVVMRNPTTGELIQCHGANTGFSAMVDSFAAHDCAAGYQAAGWVRMN
jgi:hypothetical protein